MLTNDIQQLLDQAENQIRDVKSQSATGSVNHVLVKNALENLRSALDYAAFEIRARIEHRHPNSGPERIYFPYGQRENHFKKSIKDNLPLLQSLFPKAFEAILAVQPFKSGDNWLIDLCDLTNEAKHRYLSKTEEQHSVEASIPGVARISGANFQNFVISNNYVNGRRAHDLYIGPKGNVTVVKHDGRSIVVVDTKIRFSGKALEVAPFLEHCHRNLASLLNALTPHL